MRIGRRFTLLASVLSMALGTLSGCPSRDVSAVDPSQVKEQQKEIPVNLNRDIDILWVIDDSGSMEQEQQSLADNFPAFIQVLEQIEGGLPNIHMGVISSDMGTLPHEIDGKCDEPDNGVMQIDSPVAGLDCGPLAIEGNPVRFIQDIAVEDEKSTERIRNYQGTLAEQFSCMAQLGTDGCGFEQHLASMKAALENTDENAGFYRDEAFLAVIFIQDEDDCSTSNNDIFGGAVSDDRTATFGEYSSYRCFEYGTVCDPDAERTVGPRDNCVPDEDSPYIENVQTYIDFLRGLKSDPSKIVVAEITGPTGPIQVGEDPDNNDQLWVEPACVICPDGGDDCTAGFGSDGDALVAAAPAIRMKAFLDGFSGRANFQNICTYNPETGKVDLSSALNQIALLLTRVVGNPCIEGRLADSDPAADGVQVDCRVSDVRDLNLETEEEFVVPPCDLSGPPCFRLVEQETCMTETNIALEIDRGDPPVDPPSNTTVVARCLVE
jgi:hypothetical protein